MADTRPPSLDAVEALAAAMQSKDDVFGKATVDLIAAVRRFDHAPLPPGVAFVVKGPSPPQLDNPADQPPAFIPYEIPVGPPPATGHYSHAEMPWRCGRCGVPIVAWLETAECVPGRMALPVYEDPAALPPDEEPPSA